MFHINELSMEQRNQRQSLQKLPNCVVGAHLLVVNHQEGKTSQFDGTSIQKQLPLANILSQHYQASRVWSSRNACSMQALTVITNWHIARQNYLLTHNFHIAENDKSIQATDLHVYGGFESF